MSGVAILVNPNAGGGRAGAVWRRLRGGEARLEGARVIEASDPERAGGELAALLEEGIERLIVVGGDGTLHHAANALLAAGRGAEVALGLVPAGTGSDMAKNLGLPADSAACLARALTAAPRPQDALEVATADGRRRFVVNVASAGVSGLVASAVNALSRRGKAAYLLATLGALVRYRPLPCRVTVDGELFFDGELLLAAVANGASFGGGMRVAPAAVLDDGELDVVTLARMPRWLLPLRLPRIYSGTHLQVAGAQWRRGREVEIEPTPGFPPFELDGETFAPAAPARFTLLPAALRVVA